MQNRPIQNLSHNPKTSLTLTVQDSKEKLAPLHYLKDFKENELAQFKKHFNKNLNELEELIEQHSVYYWLQYIQCLLSAGSNLLSVYYRILTGKEGIQGFAKIIDPDAKVPDETATAIGATLATVGTLTFPLFLAPSKEAALATIAFATSDPLFQRITDTLVAAKANPKQALSDTAKFVANYTLLGTTYFTASMSKLLPFMPALNAMPAGVKWLIIGTVQYFAWQYNTVYMTRSYFKGLDFWKNEEKREYLFEKIRKGEIAIPLQVFFQGIISTVGTRSFPSFYYIAEASSKALGGYIPSPLVASLVALHGLCVLYPTTFNYYIQSDEKSDALLKGKINWDEVNQRFVQHIKHLNLANLSEPELHTLKQTIINTLLQTQLPMLGEQAQKKLNPDEINLRITQQIKQLNLTGLSDTEQNKFKQLIADCIVQAEKATLNEKNRVELGYLGLFKEEPWSIVTVGWQGAIGAYFGAKFLAPLIVTNPPTYVTALSGVAGATLFAGFAHRAETNRVINNLTLKDLEVMKQKEEQEAKKAAEEKRTGADIAAKVLATGIVVANSATSTISAIGTNRLLGGSSPLLNTYVAATATQSGINQINYTLPNVTATLSSVFNGFADSCKNIYTHARSSSKQKKADDKSSVMLTKHSATLFGSQQKNEETESLEPLLPFTPARNG